VDIYFWSQDERDQLLEKVTGYDAEIDLLDTNHKRDIASMQVVDKGIKDSVSAVSGRVDTNTSLLNAMKKYDEEVDAHRKAITSDLNALKSSRDSTNNKVNSVELRVSNAEGAISNLRGADVSLAQRISTLESSTLTNRVQTLEAALALVNERLARLETPPIPPIVPFTEEQQ
jgi:chromosome segregation ATPase